MPVFWFSESKFHLTAQSSDLLEKIVSSLKLKQLARKVGLKNVSLANYFDALESQDLTYDYNQDGVVSGEDYALMMKDLSLPTEQEFTKFNKMSVDNMVSKTMSEPLSDELVLTEGDEIANDKLVLPSIKGFSSDAQNGTASVSYPINLPSGLGGLTPSLTLSYSSAAVDNMFVGLINGYRNPTSDYNYQKQAGPYGLGWNMSGFGTISRDTGHREDLSYTDDDTFQISFSAGSAKLEKESGDDTYSTWRTVPNLFIKVERFGLSQLIDGKTVWRSKWLVSTGDGTKYQFGSNSTAAWQRGNDPDKAWGTGEWFPLYEVQEGGQNITTRPWMVYKIPNYTQHYYALETQWLLNKVTNLHYIPSYDQPAIKYSYVLQEGGLDTVGDSNPDVYYAQATYPNKIKYGAEMNGSTVMGSAHEISFVRDQGERLDKMIYTGIHPTSNKTQNFRANRRIRKIIVSTANPDPANSGFITTAVYTLDYAYGYKPTDHPDNNQNGLDSADIVGGKVIHSLLTKITQWTEDPGNDGNYDYSKDHLPANVFSYEASIRTGCDLFQGGCPFKAFVGDSDIQDKTSNDFFLTSADNGYKGKVEFIYTDNDIATPVNTCDHSNLCYANHAYNSTQHLVQKTKSYDGMGNGTASFVLTEYVHTESPRAFVTSFNYIPPDHTPSEPEHYYGYEFLGYQEAMIIAYQKNSMTNRSSAIRNVYHQALIATGPNNEGCFWPSPLKGMPKKTESFDVSNSKLVQATVSKYSVVRTLPTPIATFTDDQLNTYNVCNGFNYFHDIYHVQNTAGINISYNSSEAPQLCTKTTTEYFNSFNQPQKVANLGKVICDELNNYPDDTSDTARYSYTLYSLPKLNRGLLPKPNESWVSNTNYTGGGTPGVDAGAYNYTKTYYDNLAFDQLYNGWVTSTETFMAPDFTNVYSSNVIAYHTPDTWNVASVTDALGRITSTVYDAKFYTFPVSVTDANNKTITTTYDFQLSSSDARFGVLGLPVSVTDANNSTVNTCYDKFGRSTKTYLPGRNLGSPACSGIPNTVTDYYYFNQNDGLPLCDRTKHCMPDLGAGYAPKMLTTSGTWFTNEGGSAGGQLSVSATFYNGFGQTVQSRQSWVNKEWGDSGLYVRENGTDVRRDIVSVQSYNSLGAVQYASQSLAVTPFNWNLGSSPYYPQLAENLPSAQRTESVFDGHGRLIYNYYPDGTQEGIQYYPNDPLKTTAKDKNYYANASLPTTLKHSYADAFGQTWKVEEVSVNDGGSIGTITTTYEYHPVLGSLVKTWDTNNVKVSELTYDTLGRKTALWDIDMGNWSYQYNKLSNLIFQTDPVNQSQGQKVQLCYDNLNRLVRKDIVSSSTTVCDTTPLKQLLAYEYDNGTKAIGRKTKTTSYNPVPDGTGQKIEEITYGYDSLGRGQIVSQAQTLSNMPQASMNGKQFTTQYEYDEGGRTTATTYPALNLSGLTPVPAERVAQAYKGNFSGSTSGQNVYSQNTAYNKDGQMVYFETGNSVQNSYTYNQQNQRLENLTVDKNWSDSQKINLGYQYDPVGNITRINSQSANPFHASQTFVYDALYRLRSELQASESNYTYDLIGNILQKFEGNILVNLSYQPGQSSLYYHRPQSGSINSENVSFTYDQNGNLTADLAQTYQYDQENRLIKVNRTITPPLPTPTVTQIEGSDTYPQALARQPYSAKTAKASSQAKALAFDWSASGSNDPSPFVIPLKAIKLYSWAQACDGWPAVKIYADKKYDNPPGQREVVDGEGLHITWATGQENTIELPTCTYGVCAFDSLEIVYDTDDEDNPSCDRQVHIEKVQYQYQNDDWSDWFYTCDANDTDPGCSTNNQVLKDTGGNYNLNSYFDGWDTGSTDKWGSLYVNASMRLPVPINMGGGTNPVNLGLTLSETDGGSTNVNKIITYLPLSPTPTETLPTPTLPASTPIPTMNPGLTPTPTSVQGLNSIEETNFLYDGEGQRLTKTDALGSTTYYLSPMLEISLSSDLVFSWHKNYYSGGRLVAVRSDQGLRYLHQDHLGSTVMVTSSQGNVEAEQSYHPYGAARLTDGSLPTERQYTGQVSDQTETGLYYYNARYYNPLLAKFTQADTANDSLNRYSYVANNPLIYVDPSGMTIKPPSAMQKQLQAQVADYPNEAKKATSFGEGVQSVIAHGLSLANGALDITPNKWGLKQYVSKEQALNNSLSNNLIGMVQPVGGGAFSGSKVPVRSLADFAHEAAHNIWAYLSGARIKEINMLADGGRAFTTIRFTEGLDAAAWSRIFAAGPAAEALEMGQPFAVPFSQEDIALITRFNQIAKGTLSGRVVPVHDLLFNSVPEEAFTALSQVKYALMTQSSGGRTLMQQVRDLALFLQMRYDQGIYITTEADLAAEFPKFLQQLK
jgi:RHS repeat-associated protein